MRIGYIYDFEAFPPTGGNKVHAYQLIRAFQELGHDVAVVNDRSVDGVTAFEDSPADLRELRRCVDVLCLRVDGVPIGSRPHVLELLRGDGAPVVWEINSPANENLAFSWLGGTRSRFADGMRRRLHALRQMPAIQREERLRKRLARQVAGATCVSESVGRYAREYLGIRAARVVPNGSDPDVNHPDVPPVPLPDHVQNRLKVLFAGSPMYPWQGLDLLEEAIRRSADAADPLSFLLLLNQPAEQLASLPNVLTAERVPYDQVARHVTAADVCVTLQPEFHWSPWKFHGSPTKLFDYMACGRAVVSSDVGQMAEIVRDRQCGLVCEYSAADLLDKLRWFVENPDLRREMGRNARAAVVERYNWRSIALETLDVFTAALEAPEPWLAE